MATKWCYISTKPLEEHYNTLSQEIKKQGQDNDLTLMNIKEHDFENTLNTAREEFDIIRFGPYFMDKVNDVIPQSSVQNIRINSMSDLVFDKKDGWWPRSFLKTAVTHFVSQEFNDLPVNYPAFIIGNNGVARSILAGLIEIGFTQFYLASPNEEAVKNIVTDFESSYFNSEFKYVHKHDLSLMKGLCAIVFNTLELEGNEDFLKELYYCNYLKENGILVETIRNPIETPLLKLSGEIGAKTVPGYHFWAYADIIWAKKLFQVNLDTLSYIENLKSAYLKAGAEELSIQEINEDF